MGRGDVELLKSAYEALNRGDTEAALEVSDDVSLRLVPTVWRSWAAPTVESPERSFLAVEA